MPRLDPTLRHCNLADRPELERQMWEIGDTGMEEFMQHDPVAGLYFDHLHSDFSPYVIVAWDERDPDTIVARGLSVPFSMGSPRRSALPARGWDAVIGWAHADLDHGTPPTHVSALEITIHPSVRGTGLSAYMVDALKTNAHRVAGVDELVAPVRPTGKHLEPLTAMVDYAARVRADGLPEDPWLRVHVRLGGTIVDVCPASMTIAGSLDEWRAWTGMPFDEAGPVIVPGALVPVDVHLGAGYAVYVEPNVWVRHPIT